ncbi:hypothetical protein N7501_011998 [Penicillium viridicatum]|nr:hypothetical protein N7501_011998 [Penicillium viridicatum]
MAGYQCDTKLGSDDRQSPLAHPRVEEECSAKDMRVNWHTDLMGHIFSLKRLTEVSPGFPLGVGPTSLTGGLQEETVGRLHEEAHSRNN